MDVPEGGEEEASGTVDSGSAEATGRVAGEADRDVLKYHGGRVWAARVSHWHAAGCW